MGIGSEFIREQLVFILDVVRRWWLLLCLPVALAGVLAVLATQMAPTKYVAKSLILLQAANRGSNSMQRSNAIEQIGAVEAWLKSDQVLAGILPQILDGKMPQSPGELFGRLMALRASLTLELVGGSVLEVRLEGRSPTGLGKNLEIILSRLMEGLTGPEQNIFSAPQFVLMRRSEEVASTEAALMGAIEASGAQTPLQVRAVLKQLWAMTQKHAPGQRFGAPGDGPPAAAGAPGAQTESTSQAVVRLRRSISDDPAVVEELERLNAVYQTALQKFEVLQSQSASSKSNYVGIFDSPDNLLIIGRPTDPIAGESVAKKLAIAGVLMSLIGGAGIVFLAEFFYGRMRTRREHEIASGLPVVARMAKLPRAVAA